MTQFHEIDFEDETEAGSGAFRIELDEDADPQSGTPFRIHVFSSSKYELFLSCQGRFKKISERHPVPGTGRASFVFAKSASVSAEEFAFQWIGTGHAPVFHDGEAITLAEEIPAGLCDYDTVSYADLVEVEVTEDVSALLITGRNADGETGSLTVEYADATGADAWGDACGSFAVEVVSPEDITPGAQVLFQTYGPVPIGVFAPSRNIFGGAIMQLDGVVEERTERVEFVDGWATVTGAILDDRIQFYGADRVLGTQWISEHLPRGGAWIMLVADLPTGSWNRLTADAGGTEFPGETRSNSKKVYAANLAALGDFGNGVIADVKYKTVLTRHRMDIPADWYATGYPVRFLFETCPEKEHVFPIEILVAGPPKDILVRWLDRDSQEPIEGGAVSIGLNGGALEFKGNTDENGELPILAVPTGTHTIVCVKAGYKRSDEDSMSENDTFTVTIE